MKSCYLCGKPASSKEHVPAKCFFPDDITYRKQLITVPSCAKHNEDTSADDEYVRNAISVFVLNNTIAFNHFLAKVVKSISLNKKTAGVLKKVETSEGIVYGIEVDRNRIDKIIKKISYALFYKEHKKPWNKELIVNTRHLIYSDLSRDNFAPIIDVVEQKLPPIKEKGENPKVFKYHILHDKKDLDNAIIRMVFYEGFTFWIMIDEKK